MTGEVVTWPSRVPHDEPNINARLDSVLAIFRAIDLGEFLASIPECETARATHLTAVSLLSLAERELLDLRKALGPT